MNLDEILIQIKEKLDSVSEWYMYLLFACNTTGKTRLSKMFKEQYNEEVLCYNAFLEDLFYWDNENIVLKIDHSSDLAKLINDEGLDGKIIGNFKKLTNSKIEPIFDIPNGNITFGNHTGDEVSSDNIKVSRGEESLFIWSIFYTILKETVEILQEEQDSRSTKYFDNIKYIVIDDPVSSMDDTRIITIALELLEIIKIIEEKKLNLKILICTHHSLFYNILYRKQKKGWNQYNAILSRSTDNKLDLKYQNSDSPFSYHNLIVKEIKKAITDNYIQKYHFNLFRALLEKTANFLGYNNGWGCLLDDDENKKTFVKQLNHYSHSSLSEIESRHLSDEEKEAFKNTFNAFIAKFHWSDENESI